MSTVIVEIISIEQVVVAMFKADWVASGRSTFTSELIMFGSSRSIETYLVTVEMLPKSSTKVKVIGRLVFFKSKSLNTTSICHTAGLPGPEEVISGIT